MKGFYKFMIIASMMTIVAACTNDELLVREAEEIVNVSTTIADVTVSRVSEDGKYFTNGDLITVKNLSRDTKNVGTYVYAAATDSWKTDDVMLWQGAETNSFQAWYPSTSSYTSFTIPSTQTDGLAGADWMVAASTAMKSDGSVHLEFSHMLSKVVVNVSEWSDEYALADRNIDKAKLLSGSSAVTYDGNLLAGNSTTKWVNSYIADPAGIFMAIVAPGTYAAGTEIMQIYVNASSTALKVKTTSEITIESGKSYRFWLKIGKDFISLDEGSVSIGDWNDVALNDEVVDEAAPVLEAVTSVIDNTFNYSTTEIKVKANVDYEVIIPQAASSWLKYSHTINGEYDSVMINVSGNSDVSGRSATITLQEVGGDLSASVTINQDFFEGFDDSTLNPSKYLTYVANTSSTGYGDAFDYNIYIKNTSFSTRSALVTKAEYKFQLPAGVYSNEPVLISNKDVRLYGTELRVFSYSEREDGDTYKYYATFDLTDIGVKATDVITLLIDKATDKVIVNGIEMSNGTIGTAMSSYIFSGYYYDRDDGVYEEYEPFIEDAKLYYAKGWDENGRLVYFGRASKGTNSSTGNVEACWQYQSFGSASVTESSVYANYKSEGYKPLGIGNL